MTYTHTVYWRLIFLISFFLTFIVCWRHNSYIELNHSLLSLVFDQFISSHCWIIDKALLALPCVILYGHLCYVRQSSHLKDRKRQEDLTVLEHLDKYFILPYYCFFNFYLCSISPERFSKNTYSVWDSKSMEVCVIVEG